MMKQQLNKNSGEISGNTLNEPSNKSLSKKTWQQASINKPSYTSIMENFAIGSVIAKILTCKQIAPEEVQDFLQPRLKNMMPPPFSLHDMDVAVARLVKAIKSGEQFAIFSDYDVDGATSSALLFRYFREFGLQPIIHIPDRFKEGYGPNIDAFLHLQSHGANLIITTDCGTVAFDPLEKAAKAGIETIVIDHHISEAVMPKAVAVVNPNRIDHPTKDLQNLAAVGVSFFLIAAINMKLQEEGFFAKTNITKPNILKWLDIVALGTVCDVMRLTKINRALVKQGLKLINKRANTGISALIDCANINGEIGEYHLGFAIGPRINAGGRVGEASLGSSLLCCDDATKAQERATKLNEYNQERQAIQKHITEEAMMMAQTQVQQGKRFLFVYGLDWHQGIIGIIASRVKEKFNLPVAIGCLFNIDGIDGEATKLTEVTGKQMIKASCRSIKGVDVGTSITRAKKENLLLEGGGHAMAAGFSLNANNLQDFSNFMEQAIGPQVEFAIANQTNEYVAEISTDDNLFNISQALQNLRPFGNGNQEPILKISAMKIEHISYIGASKQHLKIGFAKNSAFANLQDANKGASQKFSVVFWNYKEDENPITEYLLNNRKSIYNLYICISAELYQGNLKVKLLDAELSD
jgi:single-stranded-DNA-specific exonuclease